MRRSPRLTVAAAAAAPAVAPALPTALPAAAPGAGRKRQIRASAVPASAASPTPAVATPDPAATSPRAAAASAACKRFGDIRVDMKQRNLGTGGQADVKHGIHEGEACAVKIYKEGSLKDAAKEIEITQLLNNKDTQHRSVLRMVASCTVGKEGDVFMATELCKNGSLEDFIVRLRNGDVLPLTEEQLQHMFTSLLDGLKLLKDCKILHRDIKPANLFVFDEKLKKDGVEKTWYFCKFGDFGIAEHGSKTSKFDGTLHWKAPELWLAQPCSHMLDTYGVGMSFQALVTLHCDKFWVEAGLEDMIPRLKNEWWAPLLSAHDLDVVSPELRHLLCSMLQPEPKMRPSITDMRSSAFMRSRSLSAKDLQGLHQVELPLRRGRNEGDFNALRCRGCPLKHKCGMAPRVSVARGFFAGGDEVIKISCSEGCRSYLHRSCWQQDHRPSTSKFCEKKDQVPQCTTLGCCGRRAVVAGVMETGGKVFKQQGRLLEADGPDGGVFDLAAGRMLSAGYAACQHEAEAWATLEGQHRVACKKALNAFRTDPKQQEVLTQHTNSTLSLERVKAELEKWRAKRLKALWGCARVVSEKAGEDAAVLHQLLGKYTEWFSDHTRNIEANPEDSKAEYQSTLCKAHLWLPLMEQYERELTPAGPPPPPQAPQRRIKDKTAAPPASKDGGGSGKESRRGNGGGAGRRGGAAAGEAQA